MNRESLSAVGRRLRRYAEELVGSGPVHRRRLAGVDVRISVTGIRGKSTATRFLHDVFTNRGYDTYAKVTGVVPTSIYNGDEQEIARGEQVRLYETEQELRSAGNVDVAIVENQGIREYTTRLVNEQYVRPHVVFLTNVREDHLDTLGETRERVARSLARSIPEGTHVVCGEQDPVVRRYLEAELDRRNATIAHVDVPDVHRTVPGAELVYGLDPVIQAVDEPGVEVATLDSFLDRLRVSWTDLPGGRVYDASDANDAQSTELIRRQLVDGDGTVQPLVYLRADRRGRTASFFRYLELLADRGAIAQARVVGPGSGLVKRRASFPVYAHDEDAEDPAALLDDALADGWPVLLMGNTVATFMEELTDEIDARERRLDESAFEWGDPSEPTAEH